MVRYLTALFAATLVAATCRSQEFVVVNKMPAFSVVNRMPPVAKAQTVVTHRAPIGHTHTCTTCRKTWDHTANETHTCQFCGGHPPTIVSRDRRGNVINVTYLTDVPPRPVTVVRTVQVPAPPPVAAPVQAQRPVEYRLTFPVLKRSDCANGQCATVPR